jgi:hypothetical protein
MFEHETASTPLRDALAALDGALDQLAAVDLDAEDGRVALDAAVEQQRLANRLAALQVRLLGHVDRRGLYGLDAAVTLASWYRSRTRLDAGEAARRVNAARRLAALPRLETAFTEGTVTARHVTVITDAAIPQRAAAVAACEPALLDLAVQAPPHDVARAVARIRDLADPDGTDVSPLPRCGPDPRRYVDVHPTFDGLTEGRFRLDQTVAEALLTALEAADLPDPPDTPAVQRRSPGQRRADAFAKVIDAALDAGTLPDIQANRPTVLLTVDLATLVGDQAQPGRAPRLRFTGDLDPHQARHLALHAQVTAVLTMGPWRIVNVGRRHRTLPPWLRLLLQVAHPHCRGPDCDRPIVWTEAHHQHAWIDGGDTDLNTTLPLCKAHHDLITTGAWTAHLDPDTGTSTWTHTNDKAA